MHPIWKRLLKHGSDMLPDFNDELLLNFRKKKLAEIPEYMSNLFVDAAKVFNGKLEYMGYRELTPDERIAYLKERKIMTKYARVQDSSFSLIRYDFKFEEAIYPVYIACPYMVNNAIISNDTQFFPIFPIVDKGSIHRKPNELDVIVLRAKLSFRRSVQASFTTEDGRIFNETLVTARIHQKKVQGKNDADRLPITLYHLAKFPFEDVLNMYGFSPDEFQVTNQYIPQEGYAFIKIREDYYIKIVNKSLDDIYKRRFIAAYLEILHFLPRYELRNLYAHDGHYYKTVLGKYTFPTCTNTGTMYDGAIKHLETTDTVLDVPTMYQLSLIGINVNDIYGLLLAIFYNIDNWLVGHDPTDLFHKKLGSLEKILSHVVTRLNTQLFQIINNRKEGLKGEIIKQFTRSVSQTEDKITRSEMFRANPSFCNDNWLIGIGAQRYRSMQNTETASPEKSGKKSGKKMPKDLLKAHPSHLVVESIDHLPPSNPVSSGSINPFVQIDKDGNFIKPDWYSEIEHVFD